MNIFITPTSEEIMRDYDISEDEMDSDELLQMQGYYGDMMEIEDGDIFEIPRDCIGTIEEDHLYYMGEFPISELQSGRYELNGFNIKRVR